jgi:ribosomal protein L21E
MYHAAWEKGQLEHEDGLIYHTGEPKLTQVRQLRRRVVPKSLRQIIITAYHATPLAGHSGIYRTYWRIAARYWWPRMYLDVKEAVGACAHCKLANAVGQESKSILDAISCDTPFDVIAIDIWSPGAVPDKEGNTKALTSLDTMTGFASTAILQTATSDAVARACFATFFVPNGLPKLVLIDAGSENKGELISMCQTLRIKYHMVAPEDHNGILCERFHRYLNKVQKIGAADSQTYTQWAQGVMFATYSWNAAPIDGTNIIRSFVAKGRVFPFPLQIDEDDNPARIPPGQGEEALAHLETNFPLWARQSMMLQILVAERRERHRDLANQGRTVRKFNVGDLVIIRKQVQSSAEKGMPAKQQFKWKGIYRVMEKLSEKSYNVQKLPTVQGKGRPGKIRKYSAGVMERIPSSLIINKHLDTSDTRLATLDQDLVNNPLEQSLGFFEFGKYVKANPGADFAFDKVEDLWAIDVESDEESVDETDVPEDQIYKVTVENPADLYNRILQSRDRVVIIKSQDDVTKKWNWYATQVDWDETDEVQARELGIYRLKWLIPHHLDSKNLRRRDCRYWPEIHEVNKRGDLGRMRFISPAKASRDYVERQGWSFYEWDTDLTKDLLVGPFDLQIINKVPHRIHNSVWAQVKVKGRQLQVDTSNIDSVVAIT